MLTSVQTFSNFSLNNDLGQSSDLNHLCCVACHQPGISVRITLSGQPYNSLTLETMQLNPRVSYERVSCTLIFISPLFIFVYFFTELYFMSYMFLTLSITA